MMRPIQWRLAGDAAPGLAPSSWKDFCPPPCLAPPHRASGVPIPQQVHLQRTRKVMVSVLKCVTRCVQCLVLFLQQFPLLNDSHESAGGDCMQILVSCLHQQKDTEGSATSATRARYLHCNL